MDGHLDAWLRARALEDDVEAVGHGEVAECGADGLLRAAELLVGRLGLVGDRQAVHLLREALLERKVKPGLVDVDRDHAGRAIGFGQGARQKADSADAEDEDGGRRRGRKVCAARGMEEDGEGLCKCCLFEGTVVG